MIISIINQKGGCGKTATAINLARSLNNLGRKVLIVDLDAQKNCSTSLGLASKEANIYNVIMNQQNIKDAIRTYVNGLDIVSGDIGMSTVELPMFTMDLREHIIKNILDDVKKDYDYILLDCSPSLSLLALNAAVASDYMLVPVESSQYGLDGIEQLAGFVQRAKGINRNLDLLGVVMTLVDTREGFAKEVEEALRDIFAEKMFDTIITRDVNVKKAVSKGKALLDSFPKSRATLQYNDLAKEVIDRAERKTKVS